MIARFSRWLDALRDLRNMRAAIVHHTKLHEAQFNCLVELYQREKINMDATTEAFKAAFQAALDDLRAANDARADRVKLQDENAAANAEVQRLHDELASLQAEKDEMKVVMDAATAKLAELGYHGAPDPAEQAPAPAVLAPVEQSEPVALPSDVEG